MIIFRRIKYYDSSTGNGAVGSRKPCVGRRKRHARWKMSSHAPMMLSELRQLLFGCFLPARFGTNDSRRNPIRSILRFEIETLCNPLLLRPTNKAYPMRSADWLGVGVNNLAACVRQPIRSTAFIASESTIENRAFRSCTSFLYKRVKPTLYRSQFHCSHYHYL